MDKLFLSFLFIFIYRSLISLNHITLSTKEAKNLSEKLSAADLDILAIIGKGLNCIGLKNLISILSEKVGSSTELTWLDGGSPV